MNMNLFNQINIMDKSLDASWLRGQVISENIANADTPGYKRKEVAFEKYLKEALVSNNSLSNVDINELTPSIITDKNNFKYRMDGNNVDIDVEMVELSKNQLRYTTLIEQTKNNFNRLKMVLNSR